MHVCSPNRELLVAFGPINLKTISSFFVCVPANKCLRGMASLSRETNIKIACVEVLWPSQPDGVMLGAIIFPNHT